MSGSIRPGRRLFTRRRFLIAGGTAAAAGGLGFGGFTIYHRHQRFGRGAVDLIPDHRVDLPAAIPRMVISRGPEPALNVRAAIDRLGGMRQLITREDTVLVKPNIGWQRPPEHAANTHPDVVAEVVRLCLRRRARNGSSSPTVRSASHGPPSSGAASSTHRPRPAPRSSSPRTAATAPCLISERLGAWDILEPFVTATKIINVPVAKSHNLMGSAAGMKNWIGITTKLRYVFHNDIDRSIAELARLMKPTLTVIDASRVLMRGGPSGGSLGDVNPYGAVAAGFDPVALDAWAASIFGSDPDAPPEYLRIAQSMGLGTADYQSLQPVEVIVG